MGLPIVPSCAGQISEASAMIVGVSVILADRPAHGTYGAAHMEAAKASACFVAACRDMPHGVAMLIFALHSQNL